jgi:hypothetical protein
MEGGNSLPKYSVACMYTVWSHAKIGADHSGKWLRWRDAHTDHTQAATNCELYPLFIQSMCVINTFAMISSIAVGQFISNYVDVSLWPPKSELQKWELPVLDALEEHNLLVTVGWNWGFHSGVVDNSGVIGCDNSVSGVVFPDILKEHSAFMCKDPVVQERDLSHTASPFKEPLTPWHCVTSKKTWLPGLYSIIVNVWRCDGKGQNGLVTVVSGHWSVVGTQVFVSFTAFKVSGTHPASCAICIMHFFPMNEATRARSWSLCWN